MCIYTYLFICLYLFIMFYYYVFFFLNILRANCRHDVLTLAFQNDPFGFCLKDGLQLERLQTGKWVRAPRPSRWQLMKARPGRGFLKCHPSCVVCVTQLGEQSVGHGTLGQAVRGGAGFLVGSAGSVGGRWWCCSLKWGVSCGRDGPLGAGHVETNVPLRHPDGDTEGEAACPRGLKHQGEAWLERRVCKPSV